MPSAAIAEIVISEGLVQRIERHRMRLRQVLRCDMDYHAARSHHVFPARALLAGPAAVLGVSDDSISGGRHRRGIRIAQRDPNDVWSVGLKHDCSALAAQNEIAALRIGKRGAADHRRQCHPDGYFEKERGLGFPHAAGNQGTRSKQPSGWHRRRTSLWRASDCKLQAFKSYEHALRSVNLTREVGLGPFPIRRSRLDPGRRTGAESGMRFARTKDHRYPLKGRYRCKFRSCCSQIR